EDRVLRGLGADMAQVAEDTDAVHLGDGLAPEIAEPAIDALVAAGADQVLRVVGELDDADAELLEEPDVAELILEGTDVLEAEHDPGLARVLRAADVGGGASGRDEVGVLAEEALPLRDVPHRRLEALPDRTG